MFEEINKYKIKVHNEVKRTIYYIPNIISVEPLNDLLKATDWLVAEAVIDYNKTQKRVDMHRKKKGCSQKNIDDIEELSIRIGSRTQGYVNQLCLMEDILVYEYNRMAKLIKLASDNKIAINPSEDYKALLLKFNSIRTFRNKVVAHTAYTYPKINRKTGEFEDNPETIVRSILNLFPSPAKITMGNNMFSGFSEYRSQLPVITIYNWGQEIRPIFVNWKNLFIERLEKIHIVCPYKNKHYSIEIATPHLKMRETDSCN